MVDGSWPLTLVIRYGRSNWLAVFPINRHYGPLCQPAPLAALLFLEAPGISRAPVLALTTLQVYSATLSAASFLIRSHSVNWIKPRVPHWHFSPFYPHECICSENNNLFTFITWSIFCTEHHFIHRCPHMFLILCPCMQRTIFIVMLECSDIYACAERQTSSNTCKVNGKKPEEVELIKNNELCELSHAASR